MLTQYEHANKEFKKVVKHLVGETQYRFPKNLTKHFDDSGLTLKEYVKIYHKSFREPLFDTIEEKEKYYRWWCEIIPVPKTYRPIWEQYCYIESQPQCEQKSAAWLKQREEFITASSGADAIGESKYNPAKNMLIDKVGLGKPFKENKNVWHGKKSETIATSIYENVFNVKVGEFGMIPHLGKGRVKVPFLGASPDGICTCSTLDGHFSNFLGRMLEIKCVTTRQINDTGPEHIFKYTEKKDPGIVPHYYWVQIQLQLECCDLEWCDFWQCKLSDHWSLDLLKLNMAKIPKSMHVIGQGEEYTMDPNLEVGAFIELLPKVTSHIPSDEKVMWYGKYIYPHDMASSLEDKIEWAQNMKKNWKLLYPQYVADYNFGKIIYYHLEKSHCYLVRRDTDWFKERLPDFAAFWEQVMIHRHDKVKRQILIDEHAEIEAKKVLKANNKRKEFANISWDGDD